MTSLELKVHSQESGSSRGTYVHVQIVYLKTVAKFFHMRRNVLTLRTMTGTMRSACCLPTEIACL